MSPVQRLKEIRRIKHLEVAVDLGIESGAVDDLF